MVRKKELDDFISENVANKMIEGYTLEESKYFARKEDIKIMDDIDNNMEDIYDIWIKN
jgi:hypothetical protein